jgi:hypothetical protein
MRSIVTVDGLKDGAGPPRDLPIRRIAALGLLIRHRFKTGADELRRTA